MGAARHQRTQILATRIKLPVSQPLQGIGVERAVRVLVRRRNQSALSVVKGTLGTNVERVYASKSNQPKSMY